MFVPGNVLDRAILNDRPQQCLQRFVLQSLKGVTLQPFELDADGVVIAI